MLLLSVSFQVGRVNLPVTPHVDAPILLTPDFFLLPAVITIVPVRSIVGVVRASTPLALAFRLKARFLSSITWRIRIKEFVAIDAKLSWFHGRFLLP
jgi:hypothetical protein